MKCNTAFKKHGDPAKEAKQGQIAVTKDDFMRLPGARFTKMVKAKAAAAKKKKAAKKRQ